ncbi:Peptidase Do protein [Dioscorea alata]|uniref:Peptidase Do protein n=1 Tax=Dioscorea alata TaxID=55571 RepID=A0ACB7ULD3_DIOAL|nr:Peptidase Do protein [Dioscorea alata]
MIKISNHGSITRRAGMATLTSLHSVPSPSSTSPRKPPSTSLSSSRFTRRTSSIALLASPLLFISDNNAKAEEKKDEFQPDEEERVVFIFEETSPSVVFIKDLELPARNREADGEDEFRDAKVEGTGSGFVWDKMGHIVTNYHVVEKLANDRSGLQRCQVFFEDMNGNTFSREGKLVGYDPAYDLAVLKVDVEGDKLRPASIGSSHDLLVGQSCFAIGNPYGYDHTLTTGVVSGLGREIPSPNGRAIRGAIQTDAAINAGNSGGPLIDSYGHVIGVNTATFTRKGSGISSGVNFAIPIDIVRQTVPYLIVYGTPFNNRF